jgi:hypothetical protein
MSNSKAIPMPQFCMIQPVENQNATQRKRFEAAPRTILQQAHMIN